jgi:threonine-phosphate decarboxylase
MLDFSVNTNPFGPPRSLMKALRKNIYMIGEYPDHLNVKIFLLLAEFFGISKKNIALGVGSTQILFDIPKLISYKRAVIIVPTFWEYTAFNVLFKKTIKKIELLEKNNFEPNYLSIQRVLMPGDCMFICNINNPSSILYDKKQIFKLIEDNPSIQFVVDETYLLFRSDFAEQSLVGQVNKYANLHIVLSLSKFFSIPGLRIGVLVSDKKTVGIYREQFHIPYSLNPLVLVALDHLLKNKKFISQTRMFNDKERIRLFALLNQKLESRMKCARPEGNFILGQILSGQKSQEVKESLKKAGILIRDGHELHDISGEWIRFSIQTVKSNNILVEELDRILIHKK